MSRQRDQILMIHSAAHLLTDLGVIKCQGPSEPQFTGLSNDPIVVEFEDHMQTFSDFGAKVLEISLCLAALLFGNEWILLLIFTYAHT